MRRRSVVWSVQRAQADSRSSSRLVASQKHVFGRGLIMPEHNTYTHAHADEERHQRLRERQHGEQLTGQLPHGRGGIWATFRAEPCMLIELELIR